VSNDACRYVVELHSASAPVATSMGMAGLALPWMDPTATAPH